MNKRDPIREDVSAMLKDVDDLNRLFAALTRYLEVELVTGSEVVKTYGWTDKTYVFEFRKTRPFDVFKAEKEAEDKARACCND